MPRIDYGDRQATQWWDRDRFPATSRKLAEGVTQSARAIERAYAGRQQAILRGSALYGTASGLGSAVDTVRAKPLRENVFAAACDTWTSHIGANCPRPQWSTIDGDRDAQDRARLLMSWYDALVERTHTKQHRIEAIRDSGLFGIRAIRPYRPAPGAPIEVERVNPINLVMDDILGNGLPPELYIRRILSRAAVRSIYPQHADLIDRAPSVRFTTWFMRSTTVDAVEVWEAWHLPPVRPDEDDESEGRYVITLDNVVLHEEEWRATRYPVAFARAIPPTSGFWGNTYTDRCIALQEELNRMRRMEQEIAHVHAVPRIILPQGSSLVDTQLSDGIGLILRVTGGAPAFISPSGLSPDIHNWILEGKAAIFEAWGISQLAANQIKPAGIKSGPAFMAYADFQDKRHLFTVGEDAIAMCDFARACVDLERAEAERDPSHRVPCARGVGGLSDYRWPDIDLEDERVSLIVQAAGILPSTPSAKLEQLVNLRDKGIIDDATFFRLLDAPDFASARALGTAPTELVDKQLDDIVARAKYAPPQPYMNLLQAHARWAQHMARADLDGVPQVRKDMLARWLFELSALLRRLRDNPDQAQQLGVHPQQMPADANALATPTPGGGLAPVPVAEAGTLDAARRWGAGSGGPVQ